MLSIDWEGNINIQTSYAGLGLKDTAQVGFLNAGVGIGIAVTDVKNIEDLLGYGENVGFGVGAFGFDFASTDIYSNDINGFRVSAGAGMGIDIHVAKTYTENILQGNIFDLLFLLIGRKKYGNVYASRCSSVN